MKKKLEKVFVSPEFRKKLIYEAKIVHNMTISDYTRMLALDEDTLEKKFKQIKIKKPDFKKKGFDFGF